MAQLSNDCFAFGGALMSVDQASALIAERLAPVAGCEMVSLAAADGRVLAENVDAPIDLPPFDNAAVDGYAVRFGDLAVRGETLLPVAGRVAAGESLSGPSGPGCAVRIFTGAPMPEGFDTVFMQEDVRLHEAGVLLPPGPDARGEPALRGRGSLARINGAFRRTPPHPGRHRPRGRARLGRTVGPTQAPGRGVLHRRRNRAAGRAIGAAQLYDANRFMLLALLKRLGCVVTDLGILPDERAAVTAALASAAHGHDLLITSGGVSTGEEDHVKAAVESVGSLTFWRLAIKPGRPVAMGVVDGTPFVGLPGNPVAVFVTFLQVARPLIARLTGETFRAPVAVAVRAGFAYGKKEGRREYVRARLIRAQDGTMEAQKHPRAGAGVITSLTETDGLVELPETITRVEPGQAVGFLPYDVLR